MAQAGRLTAVVLAGAPSSSARDPWPGNKCYLNAAGRPIVLRVVEALLASRWVGHVVVIDDEARALAAVPALRPLHESGKVRFAAGADSAPASLIAAIAALGNPFPVLATTGDNALLTGEMVDHFCAEQATADADLFVAFASGRLIDARYPETQRTYLRFQDDRYSSCNLFLLRNAKALKAVELWRHVTAHRKRPWRVIAAFGIGVVARFVFARPTLAGAMAIASRRLGLTARALILPFAEAAIDVDKPADLVLAERILSTRS